MNRREAMFATASTVAALSLSALAETKPGAAAAPAKGDKKPEAPASEVNLALLRAAEHCVSTGQDCLDHCVRSLSTGDTMMAECAGTVRQMLPLCEAVAQLARIKSPHLKAVAAACAKACRECEATCKKHASHHAECKACMESCAACATECEKLG